MQGEQTEQGNKGNKGTGEKGEQGSKGNRGKRDNRDTRATEKLDSLGILSDTEYYLMGDLNCSTASTQFGSNKRLLCEISDIYGLQQLVTEPTRITVACKAGVFWSGIHELFSGMTLSRHLGR